MTGIERLRELAGGINCSVWACSDNFYCEAHDLTPNNNGGMLRDVLADIADQIEREQSEDAKAIAWVREHGGLEMVKAQRRESMPRAAYERKKAGFLDHIAECETALGRRNQRIEELGKHIQSLTTENADMRKRLMPEGLSWPVFEDGEPVRIGDVVNDVEVRSVVFRDGGILLSDCTSVPGWGTWRSYKEPIKRPAPKVLDADGVEIRVGDTVWTKAGTGMVVTLVESDKRVVMDGARGGRFVYPADQLTHRAPVLAADGAPLREGDTVYGIGQTQHRFVVRAASDYEEDEPDGRFCVPCIDKDDGDEECWCDPSQLTHERPVLDADGVLIKVGDTVYLLPGDWCDKFPLLRCHEWDAMKVLNLRPNHDTGRIECETSLGSVVCYPYPSQLTHQRPVIAADGKPLREGETVWDTNGDELVIGAIEDGGHTVTCRYADVGDAIPVHGMWSPSDLTHECPDSWERLEEDAEKDPCGYFGFDGEETCGRCPASGKNCEQTMARDLVRRCRALAERERGE